MRFHLDRACGLVLVTNLGQVYARRDTAAKIATEAIKSPPTFIERLLSTNIKGPAKTSPNAKDEELAGFCQNVSRRKRKRIPIMKLIKTIPNIPKFMYISGSHGRLKEVV
jgi:hypothetical protein